MVIVMRERMKENCANLERKRELKIDRKRSRVRLAFYAFVAQIPCNFYGTPSHFSAATSGKFRNSPDEIRSFPRYFLRTICTAR